MWTKGLIHTLKPATGGAGAGGAGGGSPEEAYEKKQVQSIGDGKEKARTEEVVTTTTAASTNATEGKSETGNDKDPDTGD